MRWSYKGKNYSDSMYKRISYNFLIDLVSHNHQILEIGEGEKQYAIKWVFAHLYLHNFTVTPK